MVKTVTKIVAAALLGAVVATVGVGAHRAYGYIGISLGLLLVAVAGIFTRAWARWIGFAAYAVAWLAMTLVYAQRGPGNSVLIAGDLHGALWLYGGVLVLILTACVPRRWLEGRDVQA